MCLILLTHVDDPALKILNMTALGHTTSSLDGRHIMLNVNKTDLFEHDHMSQDASQFITDIVDNNDNVKA